MAKVRECYSGIWPEEPVENPRLRQIVLYLEAQTGIVREGEIMAIGERTVAFSNGDWAYIHELSKK